MDEDSAEHGFRPADPVPSPDSPSPSPSSRSPLLSPRAEQHRGRVRLSARRLYPLAAFLFIATCLSTWAAQQSVTYSLAVMSILLAHELGHFLQAVRYRVPASPPLFIPMPTLFGTMGAVILQGAGYANRKALFDIAISGPLAGLVVALPVAWFGITQSTVEPLPDNAPVTVFGAPVVLQWMIEWHHGPLPENHEVILNPLLFAGWVGIFVTALNLLPVGQLDGGHILYTLIGRKAHGVALALILSAGGWMIATSNLSYILFLALIFFFGIRHPPTADDSVPLGIGRLVLGWLTLAFLLIGFTPVPLDQHTPEDHRPPVIESDEAIAV